MPDTKNLPPTKRAFIFCTKTREYLGELEAYLSPLEGIYPLPSNAVVVEPGPDPGLLKTWRLLPDGSAWEVVDDFRYIMMWDTSTAYPVPNTLALGEPPSIGTTHRIPPRFEPHECKCPAWDEHLKAWAVVPDYSRNALWVKATAERAPPLPSGARLPDTLTTLPPPTGNHVAAIWNAVTDTWDAVSDYRGITNGAEDSVSHEIERLEVEPSSANLAAPADKAN